MIDPNSISIGYDATFALNEFNQPKIKSSIEMVRDIMMYILFSKPGQYPSLPQIGLDVQSILYSFFDELNTEDLKSKLKEQCEALGIYFENGSIEIMKTVYMNQPSLIISLQGTVSYPEGYLKTASNESIYLIGISLDELNNLIYDSKGERII